MTSEGVRGAQRSALGNSSYVASSPRSLNLAPKLGKLALACYPECRELSLIDSQMPRLPVDSIARTTSIIESNERLREEAATLAKESRAKATLMAYESDMRAFSQWCVERGFESLPAAPETVSLYVTWRSTRSKPATIQRVLAGISVVHKIAGYESPTSHAAVRAVVSGVRRRLSPQQNQKTAVDIEQLRCLVNAANRTSPKGIRDQLVLLLGFTSAMRRSELVNLDVSDVLIEEQGLVIRLRRSKTNQEGDFEEIAVSRSTDVDYCPVKALVTWLALGNIREGPVLRSVDRHGNIGSGRLTPRIIADIVKRAADVAGIKGDFAGHSLRSGFATTAARMGKSERSIMRHTRHKSVTIVRRYIRQGSRWDDNASKGIGL